MRNRWLQISRNKEEIQVENNIQILKAKIDDISKPFKRTGFASILKAGYNYFLRAFSNVDVQPMWLPEYLI